MFKTLKMQRWQAEAMAVNSNGKLCIVAITESDSNPQDEIVEVHRVARSRARAPRARRS